VFTDKRSKKIILAAHCIFNQNAKLDSCAHQEGMIRELIDILLNAGIGIIQMPCPELTYLGLYRQASRDVFTTVGSEDTRIAKRMQEEASRSLCSEIGRNLVYQIQEYQLYGFHVLGVLGINGSPTCGVETTWSDDEEKKGKGIFIQSLQTELDDHGISIPMRGIKAWEIHQAMNSLQELLANASQA